MRRLASISLYFVSALLALYGLLLVLGAGGDNGRRADYVDLGGRHIDTYLAGSVSLSIAVALFAVAFAVSRHRST